MFGEVGDGLHPRGQVVRESSILVITEIFDFRTTPRHSPCSACRSRGSVEYFEDTNCRGPPRFSGIQIVDNCPVIAQILDNSRTVEKCHRQFSRDFRIDAFARSASSLDHTPASIGSSVVVIRSKNSSHVSSSRFNRSNRSFVVESTGIDVRLI